MVNTNAKIVKPIPSLMPLVGNVKMSTVQLNTRYLTLLEPVQLAQQKLVIQIVKITIASRMIQVAHANS